MKTDKKNTQQSENELLQSLSQTPDWHFNKPVRLPEQWKQMRLIRLDEINEAQHQVYQQALANVYATLNPEEPVHFLYLLDGSPDGVDLYFGVIAGSADADLHEAIKNLRGALEGQLPGINFGEEVTSAARKKILNDFQRSASQGVMLGVPTHQEQKQAGEEQSFQGVDRLVRALQSGTRAGDMNTGRWQLVVAGSPLTRQEIGQQLDMAYSLSSRLSDLIRVSTQISRSNSHQEGSSKGSSEARGENEGASTNRSKNEGASDTKNWGESSASNNSSSSNSKSSGGSESKNWGNSEAITNNNGTSKTTTNTENTNTSKTSGDSASTTTEANNKKAHHLLEWLDKQLVPRLQKGLAKGMFHSAVYLLADSNTTYQRLKNTARATFQGNEASLTPLHVFDLPDNKGGLPLHLPVLASGMAGPQDLLFQSLRKTVNKGLGSLLTADELAIVASLPEVELQGIRRCKAVDFIVDLPDTHKETALDIGEVVVHGRRYPNNRVRLEKKDLNKHTFITGVTGSGKTTTCLNLLLESGQPFLVIEPAKTEYRELASHLNEVDYYRPNGDMHQSLRLNPFALLHEKQHIKSHVSFLKNVLTTVFPMEASMPMMIEAAILAAYEEKGWDVDEDEYLPEGDPFEPLTRAWPTMSDMIRQLDQIITSYGIGKELEEKYRGSLVSRLRGLTDGTLGRILDVPQSIDFQALLTRKVVIELEELKGGEEKALMMAFLLGSMNEAIRTLHKQDNCFRHITLIEEAHRLLARPEPGDKAAAMGVEAFADMLAEVRKYGAGLIIADQIPAKLIPDVVKNTHIKIVHGLYAEDDRRAMGEAMMMGDEQRAFLPNLRTGEAVLFCGGWHGPAHVKIRHDRAQTDNQHPQNITGRSVQQLWRERERYYPQFCQLGWLSEEGDEQSRFADFVRETRQAHNHFLRMIDTANQKGNWPSVAFKLLKEWFVKWQPVAEEAYPLYQTKWNTEVLESPERLLAKAWLVMQLDANPKPKMNEKEVPLLVSNEQQDLGEACEYLFKTVAGIHTFKEWEATTKASASKSRLFDKYCNHMARFKHF